MIARTRLTAAMLTAVAMTACSSGAQHRAGRPTATTSAPSPTTSTSAEQTPLRVLSADIDGDGRADRLSYRWVKHSAHTPFTGSILVTVRFARGGKAHLVVPIDHWMNRVHQESISLPDTAAAQLDGVPGKEIVVDVDDTPASFSAYRVVTLHDGHLTLLPPPPHRRWFVGASAGAGGASYDCRDDRLIAVDMVPFAHPREPAKVVFRMIRTAYKWTLDGWIQLRRTVRRGPGIAGWWLCPQLSKWRG